MRPISGGGGVALTCPAVGCFSSRLATANFHTIVRVGVSGAYQCATCVSLLFPVCRPEFGTVVIVSESDDLRVEWSTMVSLLLMHASMSSHEQHFAAIGEQIDVRVVTLHCLTEVGCHRSAILTLLTIYT